MKRKPNSWESVAPIELRQLKYPSKSFAQAINTPIAHKSDQEIGIIWSGQSMMTFANDMRKMHKMALEEDKPRIRKLFNEWRRGYYFTPKSRGKK